MEGRKIVPPKAPEPTKPSDLMEALRESAKAAGGKARTAKRGLASGANLSTIYKTEFNLAAFRSCRAAAARNGFAGEGPAKGHGPPTHTPQSSTMSMRIATYNVNGINGRLANLLGWLEEAM